MRYPPIATVTQPLDDAFTVDGWAPLVVGEIAMGVLLAVVSKHRDLYAFKRSGLSR